jgi:hypothetical protein
MKLPSPSRSAYLSLFLLVSLTLPMFGQATTYTWTGNTSGNWSAPLDWGATSGSGTTYPGSSDTGTINNVSAATVVTYDTGASGTVGTINLTQSATSALTTLQLNRSLTIANALNMADSTDGGSNAGVTINLNGNNLNIGSSTDTTATFSVGSTSSNIPNSQYSVYGIGNVNVYGTMTFASSTGTYYQFGGGETNGTYAAVTLEGAGSVLDISDSTVSGLRLYLNGNFTADSGSTIESTSTTGGNSLYDSLLLQGVTDTIGTGVTYSGFPILNGNYGEGISIYYNGGSSTNTQNISVGSPFAFNLRQGIAGTVSAQKVVTQNYVSTATNNAVDELVLYNGSNYSTQIFQLGSNLQLASGQGNPLAFGVSTSSPVGDTAVVDLAGYSYDATLGSAGFTPSGFTGNFINTSVNPGEQIDIINSGTNSLSGNHGVIDALYFYLAYVDTNIGNSVANTGATTLTSNAITLVASGTGVTNDLGQLASGSGTINPNTLFYYTGAGSANLQVTAGSGGSRAIGGVTVGTGSSASTLKLTSAIAAAGNVTVASGATLDLNNHALSLTGTNLIGAGTIASSTAGGSIAFTLGGLTPGGGTAGATTSSLTFNTGTTVSLGVTGTTLSTSVFNLSSATAFDKILGSGTFQLNDANLTIDLLSGFSAPGTYNLFSSTSTLTGNFVDASNVTLEGANASAYTATFSGDQLSILAAPEPSTWALLAGSLLATIVVGRARHRFGPRA